MNAEDIRALQDRLTASLYEAGADLIGFADLAGTLPSERANLISGVALVIALDQAVLGRARTDVQAFHAHLRDASRRMAGLVSSCAGALEAAGFAAWIPAVSKNLPRLVGAYSHKRVATGAGLGWVGKSSLFVSFRYGPAVWLGSVLTDAPFSSAVSVGRSHCGACDACASACPYGAIRGEQWSPGIDRDRLLDADLCSGKREQAKSTLGFKHPCAFCMQACPVGASPDPSQG